MKATIELIETKARKPYVKQLECCCCGGPAPALQQWWNRDTGYGMCGKCITYCRSNGMTEAEIEQHYGREGINWFPEAEATR